ncbi:MULTISPECIES: hypothetical protein [unclassified Streptomyces]|uniref:hypothetical protein n=1 Tax=unclassified Streptomyces TaxID=2593676 RepID=UPI0037FCF0B1
MIGPEALGPLVDDLLRHLVAGDVDEAAAVLDHVVDLGDDADAYGLCVAAADAALPALRALEPEERPLARMSAALQRADSHRQFAARFLAASEQGDRPVAVALFRAEVEADAAPRRVTESLCALLALSSALVRGAQLP